MSTGNDHLANRRFPGNAAPTLNPSLARRFFTLGLQLNDSLGRWYDLHVRWELQRRSNFLRSIPHALTFCEYRPLFTGVEKDTLAVIPPMNAEKPNLLQRGGLPKSINR